MGEEIESTRGYASPLGVVLTETTSTGKDAWTRIEVRRISIFRPTLLQGPHPIQYTFTAPDDATYPAGLFYNSESGLCRMRAAGPWWVRAPQVGAAAASVQCVLLDGMSDDFATGLAISEDPSGWQAKFDPRIMASPAQNADVDQVSEALFAADSNRRFIYIRNASTGTQVIWLGIGAAAEVGKGIGLSPGEWITFDALDGISTQAFNVISTADNAIVAYQLGT